MKKEIEAFVNAANEQELEAAWNNLSAEEQRVFEQLMEEDPPEDALAFFAQLYDFILGGCYIAYMPFQILICYI